MRQLGSAEKKGRQHVNNQVRVCVTRQQHVDTWAPVCTRGFSGRRDNAFDYYLLVHLLTRQILFVLLRSMSFLRVTVTDVVLVVGDKENQRKLHYQKTQSQALL